MSWLRDQTLSWMQRLSLMVLRTGPIPRHIAFIMDGNRRFARKSKVGTVHGHSKGFDKLSEVLQWCLDMGVQEVTVYAFSIENFKRSKEEVDGIFDLARDKFRRLLSEKDKLMELGIRVEVIGNLNLFPKDIIETIAEAMTETRNNNRAVLSVAFAYTSRDEITHSIETILTGVDQQQIDTKDIDEELISRCLYTKNRPTPEILIRSSGETRLSDFLLWQTTESYVHFVNVLWPEFKFWHLWIAVFQYQRYLFGIPGGDTLSVSSKQQPHHQNSRLGSKCSNGGVANGGSNGVLSGGANHATTTTNTITTKSSARADRFVESVHSKKSAMLEELFRHSKS